MNVKYNFGAGPAILPQSVYDEAALAVKNYNGTGLSVLEISHRSPEFDEIIAESEQLLRGLLSIPKEYSVLFLAGGASQHFAQIPLNLLQTRGKAAYLDSGLWASNAIKEAMVYGDITVVASGRNTNYCAIPTEFTIPKDSAYFHYTSNNTIFGTTLYDIPESPVPIVCDMSSDILSREIDIERYGLVYASAQKNMGAAGVSVIIIRNNMLRDLDRIIPVILDYRVLIAHKSIYNTPPIFPIYVTMLNLRWLAEQGGIKEMEQRNILKAKLLYDEIDRSSLFVGKVSNIAQRSQMNVTFSLTKPELEDDFLHFMAERGIVGIKGYQGYGGFRVSLYNAQLMESVKALVNAMQEYEHKKNKVAAPAVYEI